MSSLRGFVRGGLTYTGAQFVAKALLTLLTPLWAQVLTPSELGQLTVYGTLFSLLAIGANPALHGGIGRSLMTERDEVRVRRTLSTSFWLLVGLGVAVGAVVVATAGFWFAPLGMSVDPGLWSWIFAVGLLLANLEVLPTSNWVATQQSGKVARMTIVGSAAMLLFVIVILSQGDAEPWAPVVARQISTALSLLLAVSVFARVRLEFDRGIARELLVFSLPLVPHLVAHWSLALADRALIERQLGVAALGIYGVAYFLTDVMFVAQSSWNRAWVPWFTGLAEKQAPIEEIRRASAAMYTPPIILAAVGAILAPTFFALAYPPEYAEATRLAPLLLVAAVPQSLYLSWVAVLFYRRSTRILPLATAMAAAANLGLAFALLPRLGLMGAAAATLAGYMVLAAAVAVLARREWARTVDVTHAARLALPALAVGVASSFAPWTPGTWLDGGIRAVVAVGLLGCWGYLGRGELGRTVRELRNRQPGAPG